MLDSNVLLGKDYRLSERENELRNAYIALDRPDLAACVSNARIHQRLELVIGYVMLNKHDNRCWLNLMGRLDCLTWTLRGDDPEGFPGSPGKLVERLLHRHSSDPHMEAVIRFEEEFGTSRVPAQTSPDMDSSAKQVDTSPIGVVAT